MAAKMLDETNVGIAKGREGGYACVAPGGTDPKDFEDVSKTLSELCAGASSKLESLGLIDEDGVSISTESDTDDKKDWRGDVIASPVSSFGETISVRFLETRDAVLKTVFGEQNVATSGATNTVRHNSDFGKPHVFVFDSVISATKVKRTIVPNGVIAERDDYEMNSSDLAGYKPTIKCLPSAFYNGDCLREFIYDATQATASTTGK